jgi:hypothetical protein
MFKIIVLTALAICIFAVGSVAAQEAASQRAQSLVAALDKTKYKKKEKKGFSFEMYVDVKNASAVRNPSEYSGLYQADGHSLELNVSANGAASGSGYDEPYNNSGTVKFTLQDAKVDGALLTGLKVYENGESRKFEAVFVNRTVTMGRNVNEIETRDTKFGLGYIEGGASIAGSGGNDNWTNRIFLEQRR